MRPLDSDQEARARRVSLRPLWLVELVTYTDRLAGTVDATFYLSTRAVRYDLANAGTVRDFWPVLQSISPVEIGINHLQGPGDSELVRKTLTLRVNNEPLGATRIAPRLLAHRLENARVRVYQLLLEDTGTGGAPLDLSAMVGDEATPFWRGRVVRPSAISESGLTLECEAEVPSLSWVTSTDDTETDPRDVGVAWPIVYGQAKSVRAINHLVGWYTTIAAPLDKTADDFDLEVTDASGFPNAGTFVGRFAGEHVLCSWVDDVTIHVEAGGRGYGGTRKTQHAAGELVREILDDHVIGVAGHPCTAVQRVKVRNPITKLVTTIDPVLVPYTVDLAESGIDPAGGDVTTLHFTAAALKSLVDQFKAEAEVTQQPQVSSPSGLTQLPIRSSGPWDQDDRGGNAVDDDPDTYGALQAPGTVVFEFAHPSGGLSGTQDFTIRLHRIGAWTEVRIYAGPSTSAPLIATIDDSSVPTSGTAEFSYTTAVDTDFFTVRAVGGVGGDDFLAIHEVSRSYATPGSLASSESPTSSTISGFSGTAANVRDSNLTTGVTFDGGNGDYCEVDFAAPGSDYDGQRISLTVEEGSGRPLFELTVDGQQVIDVDGNHRFELNPASAGKVTISFDTTLVGETIRITQAPAGGSWTLYEVSRRRLNFGLAVDAEIAAAEGAFGLEFFVDVDGYPAPSASPAYKASVGAVLEKPADVLRHWIEEIGGGTVDSDAYDDLATALGSGVLAFDARWLGSTWEGIAARLAFESRANLVPEERAAGTVWRMLSADASWEFPAAARELTTWEVLVEEGRDVVREVASRFLVLYALDPSRGDARESARLAASEGPEAYALALRGSADVNDFTTPADADFEAAEEAIGAIEHPPLELRAIRDTATAKDVAGYMIAEVLRLPASFRMDGVPWWEAYDLEVGDTVELSPSWRSGPVVGRVLRFEKDSGDQVDLRMVEVG